MNYLGRAIVILLYTKIMVPILMVVLQMIDNGNYVGGRLSSAIYFCAMCGMRKLIIDLYRCCKRSGVERERRSYAAVELREADCIMRCNSES